MGIVLNGTERFELRGATTNVSVIMCNDPPPACVPYNPMDTMLFHDYNMDQEMCESRQVSTINGTTTNAQITTVAPTTVVPTTSQATTIDANGTVYAIISDQHMEEEEYEYEVVTEPPFVPTGCYSNYSWTSEVRSEVDVGVFETVTETYTIESFECVREDLEEPELDMPGPEKDFKPNASEFSNAPPPEHFFPDGSQCFEDKLDLKSDSVAIWCNKPGNPAVSPQKEMDVCTIEHGATGNRTFYCTYLQLVEPNLPGNFRCASCPIKTPTAVPSDLLVKNDRQLFEVATKFSPCCSYFSENDPPRLGGDAIVVDHRAVPDGSVEDIFFAEKLVSLPGGFVASLTSGVYSLAPVHDLNNAFEVNDTLWIGGSETHTAFLDNDDWPDTPSISL